MTCSARNSESWMTVDAQHLPELSVAADKLSDGQNLCVDVSAEKEQALHEMLIPLMAVWIALWLEFSPGCPWSSPSLAWPVHSQRSLVFEVQQQTTRVPLQPSVITLALNSIWPSPLLWKASWPCALWHLHTHLKETEPASLFLNEPQWEVSSFSTY